jgi:hypothetical protein
MITVISLGAGVQSSTMALMAAHGELTPMPDCAIFADTGWEPANVYQHLDWLETVLPFPVHRVTGGDLRANAIARRNPTGATFDVVPWHVEGGIGRRQCTKDYKLRPIQRQVVTMLGGRPKGGCVSWIGISLDEAYRMKPSRVQYMINRWPLIERQMARRDCLRWLERHGYPRPPKSSCIGCPYHSNDQWRALTPEEFADAVLVDNAIRISANGRRRQFMHHSLKPLDQVDLSTAEERGQLNLFLNECEGMCGV